MKKNEKLKKTKKWRKMMKKERKMKKWIHTQNPRRFPGFTVVVVTFFVKILDECVSFPRKSTTRFAGSAFFRRKVAVFIGRETNTHFTDETQRKKFAKVSFSNNNYSFRIILPFNNPTPLSLSLAMADPFVVGAGAQWPVGS